MKHDYKSEKERDLRMWCMERVTQLMSLSPDPSGIWTPKNIIATTEALYTYITDGATDSEK